MPLIHTKPKPDKLFIFPVPEVEYAKEFSRLEFQRRRRRSHVKPIHGGIPEYVVPGISFMDISRGTGYTISCISRIFNGRRRPQWGTTVDIVEFIRGSYPDFTVKDLWGIIDARREAREEATFKKEGD